MISQRNKFSPGVSVLLCLYNCALLLDVANSGWIHFKTACIVMCTTLVLYFNYRMWWAVALSVIAVLTEFGADFPRLANHLNIEMVMGVALLIFIVLRHFGFKKNINYTTLTLIFRCFLISLYFIAGFHKINSGFFNISGSCVSYINLLFFGKHFMFPHTIVHLFQFSTIAIEMVLPFGLLFKKTRTVTVVMLLFFHIYLACCGFANFSAFAVLLLAGNLIDFEKHDELLLLKPLRIYIAGCLAAGVLGYLYVQYSGWFHVLKLLRGIVLGLALIALFKALLQYQVDFKPNHGKKLLPALTVLVLFLWGMQGYVGLSTARNFNMYSNLLTIQSRSNHYLINTNYTKIWNFEEDLVTIIKCPAEAKYYNGLIVEDYYIPMIEFKKMAKKWAQEGNDDSCVIEYKGKTIHIKSLKQSEYSKPEWWYSLLFYRLIPKDDTNVCVW